MNKKIISVLFLGVFAFSVVVPAGRALAQNSNLSIEDLQKQITQLLEMIKNLQNQLNNLRGQTRPVPMPTPVPIPAPMPDQGWDTVTGELGRVGASITQWGTHSISVSVNKSYLVKAVNDDVLTQLKKYEGQNVTLWGHLQYQNIEGGFTLPNFAEQNLGGFTGFIAKKVYAEGYGCILSPRKIGSRGDDVKVVQQYLATDKQVYPEGLVTGYYGQLTKKAVTRFQEKNGLTATGELDDGTRAKIEGVVAPTLIGSGQIYPCPTPEPPISDPRPIPSQGIRVYSPSAGENWQPGQTYKIAWNQIWPTLGCANKTGGRPELPVCVDPAPGVGNTNFAPVGPVTIALRQYIACLYEGPVRCMMAEQMPYVITYETDNNGYFTWTIPADLASQYQGKMIITVSETRVGFYGQSGVFTIGSGVTTENKPPVVSGVSGPTSLKIGETGTWTVKAYDPEGGSLSYSVGWGDELVGSMAPRMMAVQNTATFTHVYNQLYNQARTYTPVFYVTDDRGQTAITSMSVVVGGTTQTNSPPKITSISAIPTPIYVGQQASFSWLATDADGDRLFWNVNWGGNEVVYPAVTCGTSDGSNPNCWSFNAGHTWNNAGTYIVKVVVSDGRGGSDGYSFSVNVVAPPNN